MAFLVTDAIRDLLAPYIGATAGLLIGYLLIAFILLNFVMVVGGLISYLMRKVMARIHTRIGPNRVGPMGLLQFLADGVKMASKETVYPVHADRWAFRLAPYLVIIPLMVAMVPMPFANGIILSDLRFGLLFMIAVSAASPLGELVAGWASNNKYSTFGAVRAASMDISYEIPMVLAAVSVVLLAGSLSTQGIVNAQQPLWFVFLQPVGAFIFFVAALAKAGVVPTDLGESESELIAGYFTEYGGMRFGVFQINVFFGTVFISMLTVLLFLGGWTIPYVTPWLDAWSAAHFGPLLATTLVSVVGVLVFLMKTMVLTLFVLITWFTLVRLRPDQFLSLGWKVLFPLALVNLVVTAGVVFYLGGM